MFLKNYIVSCFDLYTNTPRGRKNKEDTVFACKKTGRLEATSQSAIGSDTCVRKRLYRQEIMFARHTEVRNPVFLLKRERKLRLRGF